MTRSVAHIPAKSRSAARLSLIQSMSRALLFTALRRLREGAISVEHDGVVRRFGDPHAEPVRVRIRDSRAFPAMALGGSVGVGEAFMEGLWESDDVAEVVRLLAVNRDALESIDRRLPMLTIPLRRLGYFLQRNTRAGSRRNIAAHYDLSNEFFSLFLDPTMTYSCGIFLDEESTLEEASIEKLDRACRKLELRPTDHLLEIGTGWGSMALHAAKTYGCRVTTTTISTEQATLARKRVADAGLSDRITILERDYRDLTPESVGRFDKLVSIEMIEAVGRRWFDTYFRTCSRLLKPDGLMLLQAITIRDQYFAHAARNQDWLKRYIFPGSCLLSVGAIQRSAQRATDMTVTHLEDIGPHYATTLRRWRERFDERLDDVRALGFDERFIRMWRFYFSYCEGVFASGHTSDVQALLAKPRAKPARLP